MNLIPGLLSTTLIFFLTLSPCNGQTTSSITIIEDTGSLDLVANSLVATTLAVTQDADYLEIPVNMSADNQLVVSRGIQLNRQTDVAELFADRQRDDNTYYTVDFTLNELRQLRQKNELTPEEPTLALGIPSLREELTLIKKLNTLLQKNTGVVLDIQDPQFYRKEGKEISTAILQELVTAGFLPGDKIYLQCNDPDELQNISRWSQAEKQGKYALIQGIERDKDTDQSDQATTPQPFHHWLFTNSGMRILASYAAAIALPAEMLKKGGEETINYLKSLHNYGIEVFAVQNTADNSLTQDSSQSGETTDQKSTPAVADLVVDGVYTKTLAIKKSVSLEKVATAQEAATTAPKAASPAAATDRVKAPTLPPFFSNLGLSPPQNSVAPQDSEETSEDSNKTLE